MIEFEKKMKCFDQLFIFMTFEKFKELAKEEENKKQDHKNKYNK